MSQATLQIIISVVAVVASSLFSYLAYTKSKNKEASLDAQEKGTLMSEIGYIKAGIDDLKRENAEMRKEVSDLKVRVARLEAKSKE